MPDNRCITPAEHAGRGGATLRELWDDAAIFVTWAPRIFNVKQEEFTRRYLDIARETHAVVAPVGIAWENMRRNGVQRFDESGVHPNAAGTYLAACVFFSVFYDRSAVGAEHRAVDAGMAELIQREAWRVVSRHEF